MVLICHYIDSSSYHYGLKSEEEPRASPADRERKAGLQPLKKKRIYVDFNFRELGFAYD